MVVVMKWRFSVVFGNERGQTMIEWLMLMALAFISAYLVITGPMATFTRQMLFTVRVGITNVVQNGDFKLGAPAQPGESGHPSDPSRGKALHL